MNVKLLRFVLQFSLLLLIVLVLPLVVGSLWVKVATSTIIFALAASGLSVLYAQLGLVNLCQIALVGIGGWIALRLNYATELPPTFILALAGIATSLISALLALPALRIRGLYLALLTLMAAGAFQILFTAYQFPNGGDGFWGVAPQSAIAARRPLFALTDEAYLSFTAIVVALGFVLVAYHRATLPGRAWAMIKQSEASAMAAGINVVLFKLWAFALSGFLAGIAGGLLAGELGQLDARSFIAGDGILLFALAVVGGVYSWVGAVIAGLLFKFLPALFNDFGVSTDLTMIVFGAALLHAIMTAPRGIAGQLIDTINSMGVRHD